MSDTFYPDLSAFQAGLSLRGAPFVAARASEGDWLADSAYPGFKAQAAELGTGFMAYHFIEAYSTPQAQAAFCHGIAGGTPLMLDWEPVTSATAMDAELGARPLRGGHAAAVADMLDGGSYPGVGDALAFIDTYRDLGGTCHTVYLPPWYWLELGSPSLQGFASRDCVLVSSDYTAYSDDGPGWAPYGGMSPAVWQYTDSQPFNGMAVDFNAYRGPVADLVSLARTGRTSPPPAQEEPMFGPTVVPAAAGDPCALALPDGVSTLRFCSHAAAQLRVDFFGARETEAVTLGYGQAPHVDLAGAKAVQVYRDDEGTNLVTVAGY